MTIPRARLAIVSIVLASTIVLGQLMATMSAPRGFAAEPGRIVLDTSSAYLTGLRSFAAAVLWVRIDPVMHDYYGGRSLDEMLFMVPSLEAVIWLDPHLEEPAYVLPFMLASNGRVPDALRTSDQARRDNPHSGLLIIGDAQIIDLYGRDSQRAADLVESALAPSTTWRSDLEKWNSLATGRAIFTQAGRPERAALIGTILKSIDAAHPEGLKSSDGD